MFRRLLAIAFVLYLLPSTAPAAPEHNRSRAGTGTGPFFGRSTFLATEACSENTDLSPSRPARERLPPEQTADAFLRIEGDWTGADGGKSLDQRFHFANEAISYGLAYEIAVPEDLPPGRCTSRQWAWKTGYVTLGMTEPIHANWYYQAFAAIHVDGVSLHDMPATFRAVRRAGPSVLAEGTWQTPQGPVHLRLLLRAGDDKLLVQVALPPESEARQLTLKLNAYPQGFPEPRSRRAATATQDLAASARIDLGALEQPWILLYDELYDREDRGGGPCGLVYVPEEVESAVTSLGSYGVVTTLKSKPDTRKITVGLWDFTFHRDVAALRQYLRGAGRIIADDLARVAAADWHEGVPWAQLPKDYAEKLARRAEQRRRPTAYDTMTSQIVTPHVKWARPLAGGPVRVLIVGPRWHQRETVELAQRLEVQYETVSFSGADTLIDPRSLYLYGSYELYGYPRKNETDVLYELSRKLAAVGDCLVLSGFHPDVLPLEIRGDIVEEVRRGKGLLLFGHARKMLDEFGDELEKTAWEPDVVPLGELPGVRELVDEGRPVWTAHTFGRGRVLTFHCNTGNRSVRLALTPGLSHEDPDVLGYYDYYHSLVAAGVLWAAGREPVARIRFGERCDEITVDARETLAGVTTEVMVHDPERGIRERSQAETPLNLPKGTSRHKLPALGATAGPRFTSVWLKQGDRVVAWGTGFCDRGADGPRIESVELSSTAVVAGATVTGRVQLSRVPEGATVALELRDTLGRLLMRQTIRPTEPSVPFEFVLGQPVAILHELWVRLERGGRLLDQQRAWLTVPDRRVDDFHFLVWSSGRNHAVRHHINRVLAEGGVDWIDNTGLTGGDALRAAVYCRNAARHGLASVPYITRIASMQETGRERRPCLHDPKHVASWTEGLEERARGSRAFGPPAYTLGDENFLVRRKLDVCTAPHTLAAFRAWLKDQYGSLGAVNEAWKSDYGDLQQIVPPTFDEVKETPARWPRWADHRFFMDRTLTAAHAQGRAAIRRTDPDARVGFDGVFSLDSWHGYDFYGLCRACDLVQVYATRHQQIEYLRSWHRPDSIRGAWYNHIGNRDEASAKWLAWHLLFHEFNSSWYWTSYNTGPALLLPDLRPAPQFLWMQESIDEIKGGIGKLLLAARREQDGVAVHYSQPSVHAGSLMDRSHAAAQWGFARLVEDVGLQYDMLSYDEIEQGRLGEYKVLLMPASTAISPAETEAIRAFVEGGGMVVADTVPGILDDHCRLLAEGQLDDLLGIERSGLPVRHGEAIRLRRQGPEGDLPLVTYEKSLKRKEAAEAWGAAGDVPAVLVREAGKGRAVLLNSAIEAYEGLHNARTAAPVAALMRRLLALAGIRPPVEVTADGKPVDACEVVRFTDGRVRYVTLVRDPGVHGLQPQDVTIRLPQAAHVYDVRRKQSLGQTDSVRANLVPGEPKVYALLPYAVESVKVRRGDGPDSPDGPEGGCTGNGSIPFLVTLDLGGHEPAGRHCLHAEVYGPDGSPRRHYAQNVLAEARTAKVSVPLALDAPAGTWKLRIGDVASGRTAEIAFDVACSVDRERRK